MPSAGSIVFFFGLNLARPFKKFPFAIHWQHALIQHEGPRFTVPAWPSVRRLVRIGR
ncbi:hypothetical protein C7S17_0244 [Burkholderia thailandensis]|nr:hypothetical protein [Burkholderia thailandensis]